MSAILLALSPAHAQQFAIGLEEVVVTAQKRGEESLQDVPMSIQAFGTQKLEELNITKFDDYVKFLPYVVTTPPRTIGIKFSQRFGD